jgi:hypothetical protein
MRTAVFSTSSVSCVCLAALFATDLPAQSIQRCESPDRRITYSNAECPPGTKAVRSLAPAPQPSPEASEAAAARAKRESERAGAFEEQRKKQQAEAAQDKAVRQTADCSYLVAEINTLRRMRNMLTNRPYYSLDDVNQMDEYAARLVAEYRRVCAQ